MADDVLYQGVKGVTDLMVRPGLINLDFADVRAVMDEMGKAMMGTGEATGERRAIEAAESAISNPLLDDVSLRGAKGVLINITGGKDLTLYEVDEAAQLIRNQVDENANIIVGSALDPDLDGIVRVSVVATGVDAIARDAHTPAKFQKAEEAPLPIAHSAKVVELGVHERAADAAAAEAEARAAYASYDFEETERAAVNAPPPYQAPKPYPPQIQPTQPAAQAPQARAPQAAPIPEAAPASPSRSPFGFFGRRKPATPAPAPRPAQTKPAPSGDLFGSNQDDELEIPSFLRRQNR